jgi:hypothetical protein
MKPSEIEQKNYIEKVDNFIKEAELIKSNIIKLATSIEAFATKMSELKQIEILNDSLSNLTNNISYLDECNVKLKTAFAGVEDFANLETNIESSHQTLKTIESKLKDILMSLQKIDDVSSNINLDNISNEIFNVNEKVNALNDTIYNKIIIVIQESLSETLTSINNELSNLQKSFSEYKTVSQQTINELKKENEDIKECFNELLTTNKALIDMLKEIKKTNESAKKYLDTIIDTWYDDNINFFGQKKKKKDTKALPASKSKKEK